MDTKFVLKFLKEWKWAILLLTICIAGIPFTVSFGIQSTNWGNDFWPNVFSEFLGMFVDLIFSALFTFIVIDKYTQYHKNKQWEKIKNITYKMLYFILSDILMKLNMSFPKEMRVKRYDITEDIETLVDYLPKADFDNFVNSLCENINKKLLEQPCEKDADGVAFFVDEQLRESLIKFKKHTKQDIINLNNISIPKLLAFSDDIVFLDDVVEMEELLTSLLSKITTISRENVNSNKIKCIWLVKLQEIIVKTKNISEIIKKDIQLD